MTTRDLDRFVARLRADDALAARFEQCLRAAPEERALVDVAVRFAVFEGFVVGPADMAALLEALRETSRELSDDDLDAVAGGALPYWSSWEVKRLQWNM